MAPQSKLPPSSTTQSIVILDFGAQYTQLIARRIREQNVFSVVLPCTASLNEVKSYTPAGIILSGAPWSVYDKDAPPADPHVFELGLPVLGSVMACSSWCTLSAAKCVRRRSGSTGMLKSISLQSRCFLPVWQNDSRSGCRMGMRRWNCLRDLSSRRKHLMPLLEFRMSRRGGLRCSSIRKFITREHGTEMLRNFVFSICGAKPSWTPQHFIDSTVEQVKRQVGSGRAICALSGGVDSSVAAVLVDRALRDANGKHAWAEPKGRGSRASL